MARIIPIVSIIVLILLIAGGVFLWWPKYEELKDLNSQLKIKQEALQEKQEYFAKLNTLSITLQEYEGELAKIDSALPEEISQPELFNLIQNMSAENGLILKAISSSKISSSQAETGAVKTISLSISVAGSYTAFKNFLSAIYKNSRMIEVDSIKFSSPKEEKDLFDVDLALAAHYYPKPEISEQIPGSVPLPGGGL